MKKLISMVLTLGFLGLSAPVYGAWDCSGPWKVMRNSKTSPCKALGLNSRSGTCRPGDKYEVLCDDDKGGKYRTCFGPKRCRPQHHKNRDCTYWDYTHNRPCPYGYRNYDCQGGCDSYRQDDHAYNCRNWDYHYDRPCPPGYKNYDCRGGCEPR